MKPRQGKRGPPPSVHRCTCGNMERWEDTTDAHTGTAYVRCIPCGKHWMASGQGYIDWRMGVFLDDEQHIGSDWTQKVRDGFFGSPLTSGGNGDILLSGRKRRGDTP